MDLNAAEVFDILEEKGCKALFHANTVATAKTFTENGQLMSRKCVEDKELVQSAQKSDSIDKLHGIYNDIFFDAINLSRYFQRPNVYGPVLFGFHLSLLKSEKVGTVRITKVNPIYWKEHFTDEERYYLTCDEIREMYKSGDKLRDGGNHIVFTTLTGIIPLTDPNFFGIQIDNPDFGFMNGTLIDYLVNYFGQDFVKLGLDPSKYIIVRNDYILKSQYKILSMTNREEFKRRYKPKDL